MTNYKRSMRDVAKKQFGFIPVSPAASLLNYTSSTENYLLGKQNAPSPDFPTLWVVQHQAWADFWELIANPWHEANRPNLRAIIRSDYSRKHPYLSKALRWTLRSTGLFYPIAREDERKDLSPEEKRRLNRERLREIVEGLEQNIHGVILPEGTSKTDGRIAKLQKGAYNISRGVYERGVQMTSVPVGNTRDFFSGKKRKIPGTKSDISFINFGENLFYKPIKRDPEETDADYWQRDLENYSDFIRNAYLDLNVITIGALGSIALLEIARKKDPSAHIGEVASSIERRVERLRTNEGLFFDPAILGPRLDERISNFYEAACKKGFIVDSRVSPRVLIEPTSLENYKRENVAMFSAHKLLEVAAHRRIVRDALDTRLIE